MLRVKRELFELLDSDDVADLRRALQAALELERSTMPPYLYALYSLGLSNRPARGRPPRDRAGGDASHAPRLQRAHGDRGHPMIDDPAFVPRYPTPLPGTIDNHLVVPLERYSLGLVESVFMKIEEPERPLEFPALAALATEPPAPRTIRQFYRGIADRIQALGDGIFTGDARRQVTTDRFDLDPAEQRVTDAASALRAVEIIIEQGEGTAESPKADPEELAHFYRFAELVKGRRLIPNPDADEHTPPKERFRFAGTPLPFDAAGVRPLRANPQRADYPEGSPARQLADQFSRAYTGMLKTLHRAFNGAPDEVDAAIDLMTDELTPTAREIVKVTLDDGTAPGPTFESLV